MFNKIGGITMRDKNKEKRKDHHKFNMSFDNLAIPEVNTKSHDDNEDNVGDGDSSVTYDTVAIPEIHIRKKKHK